ncbi:MAG: MarR family transcriptional regulator [Actinomycetota bacterium]|nr:MarR family transcriptional regulator [Actinomycetota bacterium]
MHATVDLNDPRAVATASVRDPANASAIGALTDLLWVMHRSRMLHQQGAPGTALVMHLVRRGAMRSCDLASAMNLDQSTVSRHLAHLDSAGLVNRSPDPADGRAQLVAATEAGREHAHRLIATRVREFEQIVGAWPAGDRSDFARLLTRFSEEFADQMQPDA